MYLISRGCLSLSVFEFLELMDGLCILGNVRVHCMCLEQRECRLCVCVQESWRVCILWLWSCIWIFLGVTHETVVYLYF